MMNERPRLNSLATVTPKHKLVQSEVAKAAADLFSKEFNDFDRLLPVYTKAEIDTPSSCGPRHC